MSKELDVYVELEKSVSELEKELLIIRSKISTLIINSGLSSIYGLIHNFEFRMHLYLEDNVVDKGVLFEVVYSDWSELFTDDDLGCISDILEYKGIDYKMEDDNLVLYKEI